MCSSVRKTAVRTVAIALLCALLCVFGAGAEEAFTDADSKAAWVVENYTDSSMTEEEKALALHDWLILNAYYDTTLAAPNSHEAAGVLLDGTGVCDSYSKAYVLLLSKAGIESKRVTGNAVTANGNLESHAWNLVKLAGKWYQVDVTWDDPVDPNNPTEKYSGLEHRLYFKASKRFMNEEHRPDPESAALIDQLVEDDAGSEETLPAGVDHSKSYDLPEVNLISTSGAGVTGETMRGKDMILVYGRIACVNTRAFLSNISPFMDLLKRRNVQVTVALYDDPSGNEMREFAEMYPGIVCTKVATDDYSMWEGLDAFGNGSGSVIFPVIFLKNRNNKLTYCSTGVVEQPLAVVSGALAMAGEDQQPDPEPEPEPDPQPQPDPVPVTDPVQAFVIRCYSLILGRDPDPDGLAYWTNHLKSGTKMASEIIDGFVNSQEYLGKNYNDAESVEILYMAMLNRGSDTAGKNYWMSALHVGNPFAVIINGFCGSQEFMGLCSEYGIQPGSVQTGETIPFDPNWVAPDITKIQAYVTRCYKVILSRDPDPSGLADWTNQLYSGKKKAAEIIDGFVNSQEFLGKNLSNEDAVEVLYNAMLGRGSDAAGKADWVGKLNEGNPYASVINGFCGSQEFMALCKEYGIEPGSVAVTTLKAASPAPEEADAEESADVPAEPAAETEAAAEPETQAPAETEENTVAEAASGEPAAADTEPAPSDPAARSKAKGLKQDKVEAFVLRCYRIALNREPGADELDRYVTMIMDGKKSVRQVVQGFIFSDEFKARNLGNEEVIRILYRLYLDREADEEGLAHWLAALNDAGNLGAIVNSFAGSSEFNAAMQKMRR